MRLCTDTDEGRNEIKKLTVLGRLSIMGPISMRELCSRGEGSIGFLDGIFTLMQTSHHHQPFSCNLRLILSHHKSFFHHCEGHVCNISHHLPKDTNYSVTSDYLLTTIHSLQSIHPQPVHSFTMCRLSNSHQP